MEDVQESPTRGMLAALVMGAIVPFALALVAHGFGPRPSPLATAAERPALAFQQYLVDLGRVPPLEEVSARFRFVNMGERPLTIGQIIPSCGCLQPRLSRKTYAPGETGELVVRVQTASEAPGGKAYHVQVDYDDGQPRQAELDFRVELPDRQVIVRPRALTIYQFGTKPTVEELVVTDYRSEPLSVEGVSCSSPLVQLELGTSDADADGNVRHRVQVKLAATIPPGVHRALVRIYTNDATYRELKVPLVIQGQSAAVPQTAVAPGVGRRTQ